MKAPHTPEEVMEDPAVWRDRFSVGGLKYVLDSRHRCEQVFWAVFVTVGTVVVTLLLVSTIKGFTDNPVRSNLDDTFSLRKVPFPSVTVCKTRPGLEQYGLVEAVLNWVHPEEPAVNATVGLVEKFISSNMAINADTILAAGTGTKLVAFLSLDGNQDKMPKGQASKFSNIVNGIKTVVNELMAPLLNVTVDSEMNFLEINTFFVETASNWQLTSLATSVDQKVGESSTLLHECRNSVKTKSASIPLCKEPVTDPKCKRYCSAYRAILDDRRLQAALLEHSISPPTLLMQEKRTEEGKNPWYVAELAKKFRMTTPPVYDPNYKSFTTATKCFYGKRELGPKIKRKVGKNSSYRVCGDFQQTITDVGVCATFHAAESTTLWIGSGYTTGEALKTKGTGTLTGLTAVVSENLMNWQLSLVEPVLLRVHDSNSFATFIPGDFTDVDKEAVNVPVMYLNEVAVSTKVVETTESFKRLSPKTRGCYLKGTDTIEMEMLRWAEYTKSNCVLDCKLTRAAEECGCVPWYIRFRHPMLGKSGCEHSGHRCFIEQLLGFTSWDEDGERLPDDVVEQVHNSTHGDSGSNSSDNSSSSMGVESRPLCQCLPECDEFSYYSNLAFTSAQKIRHEKYGWLSPLPRQNSAQSCSKRFEGRLLEVNCDPASGLYKQRLGDFFAPNGSSTSDWERETTVVSVYFDRARQLATVKDGTPLSTVMSQVGGTMGLYTQLTGWSFITLLHLIIIMAQTGLACAVYSGKRKVHHQQVGGGGESKTKSAARMVAS